MIGTGRRAHGPICMRRAILLLFALLVGCSTPPKGRANDHVIGVLVLTGTETPIVGAEVSLVPVEPVAANADPADEPEALATKVPTEELGAFLFSSLSTDAPRPLLRGWLYELHATAPGFYSTTERVQFDRGQLALTIEIDVIDDTAMEGAHFVGEQPPDRLKGVDGTLIDEVLRRQGRVPPPGF